MISKLSRLLGMSTTQAEESMYSERAAKHVLSRRSFAGLSAAMVVGTVLVSYKKADWLPWNDPSKLYVEIGNEYSVYGRVAVDRSPEMWAISGGVAKSKKPITFPESHGGLSLKCDRIWVYDASGRRLLGGYLSNMIDARDKYITPQITSITAICYDDLHINLSAVLG